MKITVELLRELGACKPHVDRFAARWPDGVEPDAAALAEAHRIDLDVRWLAERPGTPPEVLAALATDTDRYVRFRVARHPHAPYAALATLATDQDTEVRYCVATHPHAPPEALATLATDAYSYVRWRVARHPSAPHEALATLTTDADADVRKAAARRYQQFADRGRPRPVAAANSDDVRPAPKRT